MPNWCYQNLRIKGPKDQLTKFKADMLAVAAKDPNWKPDDTPFTFELFAKFPEIFTVVDTWCGTNGNSDTPLTEEQKALVLKECGSLVKGEVLAYLTKTYGASGWYAWNCENWGTKWDAGDAYLAGETDEELNYSYQTAWSPALPALLKGSEKYPELTFHVTFTEEGGGFAGLREFAKGECTREVDCDPALGNSGSLNVKTFEYVLAMATMPKEDVARIIGNIQNIEEDAWIDAEVFEKVGQAILAGELDSDSEEFLDQLIKVFDMEFDPAAEEIFGDDIYATRESLEDEISNWDDEAELERIRRDLLIGPAIKDKEEVAAE
jgi:hypothetical protein